MKIRYKCFSIIVILVILLNSICYADGIALEPGGNDYKSGVIYGGFAIVLTILLTIIVIKINDKKK